MAAKHKGRIFYQGEPGAHSHLACLEAFPKYEACEAATFVDLFAALETQTKKSQTATPDLAMVPVENALAGRVGDVHHLLAHAAVEIIGEHFQPVHHHLWGLRGAKLEEIRFVLSHAMALGQCRHMIEEMGVAVLVWADTAGAARWCAERGDRQYSAIASPLAGKLHDLQILKRNVGDAPNNMTRFLIVRRADPKKPAEKKSSKKTGQQMTSFLFELGNVPAALYKALGGFASNGVNMTRLESFPIEGGFAATHFYADIEGSPEDPPVRRAFEELDFFARNWKILGCYPASPVRKRLKA